MVVKRDLDQLAGGDFHQGVGAYVGKMPEPTWDELVAAAHRGRPIIVLDHVADPRNFGAIIRSAAAFGAGAVIYPVRRQAPLTAAATKAAEGGLEYVPLCAVGNITQVIERLNAAAIWCYALEGEGRARLDNFKFAEAAAFVLGGEDAGINASARAACDATVRIPMDVDTFSLNVAAAAAVALFEYRKQFALL